MYLVARVGAGSASASIRDGAAQWLGETGTRNDVYLLRNLCSDSSWVVRCSACSSLARVGGRVQGKFLANRIPLERNPVVRRWLYVALSDAMSELAIPFLKKFEQSERSERAIVGIYSAYKDLGVPISEESVLLCRKWLDQV